MPSVKPTPPEPREEIPTLTRTEHTVARKSSVLRAASALGIINEKPPPLVYVPKRAWIPQPTTDDLLKVREVRRSRFGTDIDFEDYKPAFQKHISQKAEIIQKQDP